MAVLHRRGLDGTLANVEQLEDKRKLKGRVEGMFYSVVRFVFGGSTVKVQVITYRLFLSLLFLLLQHQIEEPAILPDNDPLN